MNISNRPSTLINNILTGSSARIIRALLQIAIIPFIISSLGADQYGLIALTMTLQMLFFMLDQAISPAVVRELSQTEANENFNKKAITVFFTFERICLGLSVIMGATVIILAPFISQQWLNFQNLTLQHVETSIILIGVFLAIQWPSLFYTSFLTGLNNQKPFAIVTIAASLIQTILIITFFHVIKPDVIIYIYIQILCAFLSSIALRICILKIIKNKRKCLFNKFDKNLLNKIYVYAGSTFFIGVTSAFLTQVDKIFISYLFPLSSFSAYALAFNIVSQLTLMIVVPVIIAIQPELNRVYSEGDQNKLHIFYRKYSQIASVIAFGFFLTFAFFSEPVLKLWLGVNSPLLGEMLLYMPPILIGSMLNTLAFMPYLLQLASGNLKVKMWINGIQVIAATLLFVPLYLIFGIWAGIIIWCAINVMYLLIEAPLAHRYLIHGAHTAWLFSDVMQPGIFAIGFLLVWDYLLPNPSLVELHVIQGVLCGAILCLTLIFILPHARKEFLCLFLKANEFNKKIST